MYTKGPWVVHEGGGRWWIDAESGNQITPSCNYENENDRDDARLIAAAPELLDALKAAGHVLLGCGFSAGEENGIIGTTLGTRRGG